MDKQADRATLIVWIIIGGAIIVALYSLSRINYPLFHTLVELFSILVAMSIFIIAWNSRHSTDNFYILFIGIAYLFIGSIDLIHTLSYKGIAIFPGYNSNLTAQLWIVGRYMESVSFLFALLFMHKKINPNYIFVSYSAAFVILVGLAFGRIFPDCYIEGVGLTPFKMISEYIIIIILFFNIVLLFRSRKEFETGVFQYTMSALFVTVGAEFAFTLYADVFGFFNMVGHVLKIVSFYLIYRAIIGTSFLQPHELLFRRLQNSEEQLIKLTNDLIQDINERKKIGLALEQEIKINKAIAELSRALLLPISIEEVANLVLKCAQQLTNSKYGFVGYISPKTGHLIVPTLTKDIWEECKISEKSIEFKEFKGLFGWVLNNQKPLLTNNPTEDSRSSGTPIGHIKLRNFLSAPAVIHRQLVGQIAVANSEKAYTDKELNVIERLANLYAIAIQRQQIEKALKNENQRIETIVEIIPNGVLFLDSEGHVYLINRTLQDLYKQTYQENLQWGDDFSKLPENNLINTFKEIILDETWEKGENYVIRKTIGLETNTYIETFATIIHLTEEEILGFLFVTHDVTPFIELENLRNQFVSSVSHELRTPITSINLTIKNLLKYGKRLPEKQKESMLNMVARSATILSEMIEDLLIASRIEGDQFKVEMFEYQLFDVLLDIINQMESRCAEKKIVLQLDADPKIRLIGDTRRIGQIFRILIDNAVKYSPDRSTININVIDQYQGDYNPEKREGVLIQVKDEGQGIPEKELPNLFVRFFRASNVKNIPGTGLGLSIARDLVLQHKGEIFVESKLGEGSIFSIFLPKLALKMILEGERIEI
ncbi:MAG: MASE3 domain-containing protein [Candidatus Hodarchaeota archaeon]